MLMCNFYVKSQKLEASSIKIDDNIAHLARLKQGVCDAYFETISRQSHDSVENLWAILKNTIHELLDALYNANLLRVLLVYLG